jgi:hypothetical protein
MSAAFLRINALEVRKQQAASAPFADYDAIFNNVKLVRESISSISPSTSTLQSSSESSPTVTGSNAVRDAALTAFV